MVEGCVDQERPGWICWGPTPLLLPPTSTDVVFLVVGCVLCLQDLREPLSSLNKGGIVLEGGGRRGIMTRTRGSGSGGGGKEMLLQQQQQQQQLTASGRPRRERAMRRHEEEFEEEDLDDEEEDDEGECTNTRICLSTAGSCGAHQEVLL